MTAWTNVPKPQESSVVSVTYTGGDPIGLLLALTYSTATSGAPSLITGWGDIQKPTVSSWVSVAKPTT